MGQSDSKEKAPPGHDVSHPHATPTRGSSGGGHGNSNSNSNHNSNSSGNPRRDGSQSRSSRAPFVANLTPSPIATPAPPSTSQINASPSSAAHSRQRSITTNNASRLRPEDSTPGSQHSNHSAMGQEASRSARPPSRGATYPPSTSTEKEKPQPVDVPQPPADPHVLNEKDVSSPTDPASPYGVPASNFNRPPRLPLPIDPPEPASPLLSPAEVTSPVEVHDADGLPRRHSMLSSTTLDEDEELDVAAFNMDQDASQPKVPTTISWRHPAHQVYITGTFVKWERKVKMHRVAETGQHSILLHLTPGTHHLKFLVDGEMVTSNEYPTTVDFTNALMNYLEIVPQPPAPAEPMPIPGATVPSAAVDIPPATQTADPVDELSATLHETVLPTPATASAEQHMPDSQYQPHQPSQPTKRTIPRAKYTNAIPDMLLHLDLYGTPDDERYQRASKVVQHLPNPPSLPMFMQKSILNATTPHKDDASVLTMPNHTVINHLATSSIRSGVLATSGTTRYKRKVRKLPDTLIRTTITDMRSSSSRPSCTNPPRKAGECDPHTPVDVRYTITQQRMNVFSALREIHQSTRRFSPFTLLSMNRDRDGSCR